MDSGFILCITEIRFFCKPMHVTILFVALFSLLSIFVFRLSNFIGSSSFVVHPEMITGRKWSYQQASDHHNITNLVLKNSLGTSQHHHLVSWQHFLLFTRHLGAVLLLLSKVTWVQTGSSFFVVINIFHSFFLVPSLLVCLPILCNWRSSCEIIRRLNS